MDNKESQSSVLDLTPTQLTDLFRKIADVSESMSQIELVKYLRQVGNVGLNEIFLNSIVKPYFEHFAALSGVDLKKTLPSVDLKNFIQSYFDYRTDPNSYAQWFQLISPVYSQGYLNTAEQYLNAAKEVAQFASKSLQDVGAIVTEVSGALMSFANLFVSEKKDEKKTITFKNASSKPIRVLMFVVKCWVPIDKEPRWDPVLLDSSIEGVLKSSTSENNTILSTTVLFSWRNGKLGKYHSNRYYIFVGPTNEKAAEFFVIDGFIKDVADRFNDDATTFIEYTEKQTLTYYEAGYELDPTYGRPKNDLGPNNNVTFGFENPKLEFKEKFNEIQDTFKKNLKQ